MQPGGEPFSPPSDKADPFSKAPQADPFASDPPPAPSQVSPEPVYVGQPATIPTQQALTGQTINIGGGSPTAAYAIPPATSAVAALVLAILSWVCGGICFSLPAVLMANNALAITRQHPGHPDAGTAKAAQITAWINIGLSLIVI